ncbi:MAG: hypothetical protein WCS37_20870, partial [Chloroflexota bacterium]
MGILSNLFELVRDRSYQEIEEEVNREVTIALGGNSLEARDRLHKALSRPMESLWTANPFRLVETNEQPTADSETGGLLLYSLYQKERISREKRQWLQEVATSPNVSIIVTVIPRQKDEPSEPRVGGNLGQRLQAFNLLRLVVGNGTEPTIPTGAGADGASFTSTLSETQPIWEAELAELESESNGKLHVVRLSRLTLGSLERELLPIIVRRLEGRELALAKRAPVFRNSVANHFINSTARSNTELVLMANLTSGLPFVGDFFGGGADFVALTKNQFELSHRLASVYGQKRNGWVELYLELAPIVVGAFIWRGLSRTLTEKLPPLLATFPKGAVA